MRVGFRLPSAALSLQLRASYCHGYDAPVSRHVHIPAVKSRAPLYEWREQLLRRLKGASSVTHRVAMYLAERFRHKKGGWTERIHRSRIASQIGATVRSVGRALRDLQERGLIYVDSGAPWRRANRFFPAFGPKEGSRLWLVVEKVRQVAEERQRLRAERIKLRAATRDKDVLRCTLKDNQESEGAWRRPDATPQDRLKRLIEVVRKGQEPRITGI